jgi:hypothetical protein
LWYEGKDRKEREDDFNKKKAKAFFFLRSFFLSPLLLFHDFHRKPPWCFSRNPDMKIMEERLTFVVRREREKRTRQ